MISAEMVPFGTLYKIPSSNGLSRPSNVRGAGFKMINMGELFANDIINDIEMERVQMSDKEIDKFMVEKGDLLFARQSLVASGAGKCSIVNDMSEPTTFESHLIRVRLDSEKCNPWFYYYLFKLPSNPIKSIVNQCAQAGIRGTELVKVKVPYIDMGMQDRIVEILTRYDQAIGNNNKRIKILEQVAENLYKEWFVRFRFPGHENVEFENGIPKGWEIRGLFEIANVKYGYSFSSEDFCEDITLKPVVRIRDVPNNKTNTYTAEECDEKYQIRENDILIGMDGIFHMCLWSGGLAYLNQRVVDIESKYPNKICNYYLYFSLYPQVKFWEATITGTTVAHLGDKHLKKMKVIIPDDTVLLKANEVLRQIMLQITVLRKENTNLVKQRNLLLPRLMSGKLEI